MKIPILLILFTTGLFATGCASREAATPCQKCRETRSSLDVDKLSSEHIAEVKALITTLKPFIQAKDQAGELPALTFKELESPLDTRQRKLLRSFLDLNAGAVGVKIPFQKLSQGETGLIRLDGQKIRMKGEPMVLPPQFLSPHVHQAYQFMMRAMERDIGKRLFVESAYRSSAYQLYLFIYYLSNHDYSIRETAKWVALPGYSEHGNPEHLALDFINSEGINGEYNVAEFEALPEYRWLLANASRFGFVLSYPKDISVNITYEPWHWRYEGTG